MVPFNATRALALESIAVLDTLRSVAGQPGFMVRLSAPRTYRQSWRPTRRRMRCYGWDRLVAVQTGTEPGRWRPTPPRFYPPLNPQWALVTPFTLTKPDQARPPGPRAPGSKEFNDARFETASVGAAQAVTRTADQTLAAHYRSDAIGTYAPADLHHPHRRCRFSGAAQLDAAVGNAASSDRYFRPCGLQRRRRNGSDVGVRHKTFSRWQCKHAGREPGFRQLPASGRGSRE